MPNTPTPLPQNAKPEVPSDTQGGKKVYWHWNEVRIANRQAKATWLRRLGEATTNEEVELAYMALKRLRQDDLINALQRILVLKAYFLFLFCCLLIVAGVWDGNENYIKYGLLAFSGTLLASGAEYALIGIKRVSSTSSSSASIKTKLLQ